MFLQDVGLEEITKPTSTPNDRSSKDPRCRNGIANSPTDGELSNPSAASQCRGIVARMKYLGQDGSQIQFVVKELGKEMSAPTQASWPRIKRFLRRLEGAPKAALKFRLPTEAELTPHLDQQ